MFFYRSPKIALKNTQNSPIYSILKLAFLEIFKNKISFFSIFLKKIFYFIALLAFCMLILWLVLVGVKVEERRRDKLYPAPYGSNILLSFLIKRTLQA